MTEIEFWEVLDDVADDTDTVDEVVDGLRDVLEAMPREQVVAFQVAFNTVMARAYTWDLIAAACFIGCGKSDDGFEDFRAWLVAQGKDTFEAVLNDVNVLADLPFDDSPTEEWNCEDLHMLPGEIGGEEEDAKWPYRKDPENPQGDVVVLTKAHLRARFPKLWQTFGDQFMIGIE
jgi:hypothetical protein